MDTPTRSRRRTLAVAGSLLIAALVVARVAGSRHDAGTVGVPEATSPTRQPRADQPELAWIDDHGAALPVTRAGGPQDASEGRSRLFLHTADGAVQAALHLVVRTEPEVGPSVFAPTITEQVVGPFRDAMLQATTARYDERRLAAGSAEGAPLDAPVADRPVGYVVADAQPDAVTIDVVLDGTGGGGRRLLRGLQVLWGGDDWQLVAPGPDQSGRWPNEPLATDPPGFTPLPLRSG